MQRGSVVAERVDMRKVGGERDCVCERERERERAREGDTHTGRNRVRKPRVL